MSVGHFAGWGHVPVPGCFSEEVWDPFYPFPTIQSEKLADAAFQWKETKECHLLTARLPGVKNSHSLTLNEFKLVKEEVKVEVESGGVLKISGKRKAEMKEETREARVERSCSEEFLRRFRLPENAMGAELKAAMKEDGVLTVTVPKCSQVKVVQIL